MELFVTVFVCYCLCLFVIVYDCLELFVTVCNCLRLFVCTLRLLVSNLLLFKIYIDIKYSSKERMENKTEE